MSTLLILVGVGALVFVEMVLLARYPAALDWVMDTVFGWFERHFAKK